MITFKKFAMAIMLIAGFQQVSADVCKLRVNDEIKAELDKNDEVWILKKNGNISYVRGGNVADSDCKYIFNGEILCVNRFTEFKDFHGTITYPKKSYKKRYKKENAKEETITIGYEYVAHIVKIGGRFNTSETKKTLEASKTFYCDKDGYVVINVNGRNVEERHDVAKRQFENIIKCGLVNDGVINRQIYDTPFENTVTNVKKWQMPGISADISKISDQNVTTIPVLCAMKINTDYYLNSLPLSEQDAYFAFIKTLTKYSKKVDPTSRVTFNNRQTAVSDLVIQAICPHLILSNKDWMEVFNNVGYNKKDIYNIEHTERQMLIQHMFGDIDYSNFKGSIIKSKKKNDVSHLLVYTDGAPCFEEGYTKMPDNGGTCCWNIYRVVPSSISIDVYFSTLNTARPADDIQIRRAIFGNQISDNQNTFTDNVIDALKNVNTRKTTFTSLMQMSDWYNNHRNITFTWL